MHFVKEINLKNIKKINETKNNLKNGSFFLDSILFNSCLNFVTI